LRRRRHRADAGRLLVEGPHAVAEAVGHLDQLFVGATRSAAADAVVERCRAQGVPVVAVTDAVLAALCDAEHPQGVVGVATRPPADLDVVLRHARLLVVLDQIADPGNLGTVVRTADAAGADAVVLTAGSVDPTNAKAVRASVGSLFHLPVVDGVGAEELCARCRHAGVRLLGTAADAATRYDHVSYVGPVAVAFGNETRGLSPALRAGVERTVALPIARRVRSGFRGHAESLNLATTAAVVLYEAARQRGGDGVDGRQ
jgi:TrmH family RNA methyltransferase